MTILYFVLSLANTFKNIVQFWSKQQYYTEYITL
jgi:hypothetical protein